MSQTTEAPIYTPKVSTDQYILSEDKPEEESPPAPESPPEEESKLAVRSAAFLAR